MHWNKWLFCNVVFALLPLLLKFGIYIVVDNSREDLRFDILDLIIFALLLNITTINANEFGGNVIKGSINNYSLSLVFFLILFYIVVVMKRYDLMSERSTLNETKISYITYSVSMVSVFLNYKVVKKK